MKNLLLTQLPDSAIKPFGQFAKVIAHCGQSHRIGKLLAMPGKGVAQVTPELAARAVAHPERQHNAKEGYHVAGKPIALRLGRACDYPLQAIERALIVFAGTVDCAHNRFIAFDETRGFHPWDEVQRAIGIVPRALKEQSPFAIEPSPELSVGQRRQQTDHRKRNRALPNKLNLPLKDVIRIVVESDDEARHHFHTVALYLSDGVEKVAPRVLPLLSLLEARLDRGLDAEKDAAEARAPHSVKQFIVLGEIHAGFGNKRERAPVTLRPLGQDREQPLDVALVADKVIVNDENRPAPADPKERVQLSQHLLIALRAGGAAIDLDDVAELALEGTAARVLDRHRAVASEVGEMEIGD